MNRRWPASDTVPSSTGAKSRNTCTALLQIHVCHTSLIIRISLSKYTTEEKTMHEILEDDENVGAPGSWASPRLDENHHTSARRFRLPIKGVFPFDAPPRRYFLFFSLCYSRRRFTLRRRHSPCGRGFLCIGERGATLVRVSRVHGSFSLYTRVSVYPLL